jgi:hypothetical protein
LQITALHREGVGLEMVVVNGKGSFVELKEPWMGPTTGKETECIRLRKVQMKQKEERDGGRRIVK